MRRGNKRIGLDEVITLKKNEGIEKNNVYKDS